MDVEEITEDIRGEKCDEEDDFQSVAMHPSKARKRQCVWVLGLNTVNRREIYMYFRQ